MKLLSAYVMVWGPIATIISATLWYMDAKDIEIKYMAEIRYFIALSAAFPALILALCELGIFGVNNSKS